MGVPGDLLDIILLGLMLMFAVSGYRHGLIVGLLSLVGFFAGVAAGAFVGPAVARVLTSSASGRALIAILAAFVIAVAGMLLASWAGIAVRTRLAGRQVTLIDSIGGAVMSGLAVVVIFWLIGAFAGSAPTSAISRQVAGSLVLRTLDRIVPPDQLRLAASPTLRDIVNVGRYTKLFAALGPGTAGLPPASGSVLTSPAVVADRQSVVKISGSSRACHSKKKAEIEGSGFVIAPGHVLTNAHVVAGVTSRPDVITESGRSYPGQVVLYDATRDVAVLYVPGLHAPALKLAGSASYGTSAVMAGYPLAGQLTLSAVRVAHSLHADIEGAGIASVFRQVYPILAMVRPGNSGGPLLASDGRVYGVVFAQSTSQSLTGYALTTSEVETDVQTGADAVRPVHVPVTSGC
jgi:S1-C subfamily serine protease